MTVLRVVLLALLFCLPLASQAAINTLPFQNNAQEKRYDHLIEELRCLVCQNQNLADSNADLAKDLRTQVYNMIMQGKSDQEILDYMVDRYGDFVLYRPPVKSTTYLLWAGPFLLLLLAFITTILFIRNRAKGTEPSMSEHDQARLQKLLQKNNKDSNS